MRSRNLQERSAAENRLQATQNTTDWQWILAMIIAVVTILLMLSTALHIL